MTSEFDGTHLLIVKTEAARVLLRKEQPIIAEMSELGHAMECGDAMVAKEDLVAGGFEWGKNFYIRRVEGKAYDA